MLKQRILTAIILIPLFILLVLKLPTLWFALLTGILTVFAAYEWSGLLGINTVPRVFIYPLIIALLLIASVALYLPFTIYAACIWWIIATILILLYPKASECWGKGIFGRGLMGIIVLLPTWMAINFIRVENGAYGLLFLFVLIWGADSAAYFTGKKWGKHKLAPLVSPGKTWEGFAGALVMTIIITIVTLVSFHVPYAMWLAVIILSLITVVFSVIGDLFESMLKRNAGIKDSGRLFPGHGGILDRIDSLTAAAPIFVLGTMILGKIYH